MKMKTIERMMYAVHRDDLGAIYVAKTKREAERWLARELFENPELEEYTHTIKYEKWHWHE